MFTTFSDLLSRAASLSALIAMLALALIPLGNLVFRHKRRIVNMIEEPAGEFTS
jgi:hypothetical protein